MTNSLVNMVLKKGGAMVMGNNKPSFGMILLLVLFGVVFFLIKAWIIQIAYNAVMPHILVSLNRQYDPYQNFAPLSYAAALLFSILIYLLF